MEILNRIQTIVRSYVNKYPNDINTIYDIFKEAIERLDNSEERSIKIDLTRDLFNKIRRYIDLFNLMTNHTYSSYIQLDKSIVQIDKPIKSSGSELIQGSKVVNIDKNGEIKITPDPGFDLLKEVIVLVNMTNQSKEVEITKTGVSILVEPDEGYAGLDSVLITSDISSYVLTVRYQYSNGEIINEVTKTLINGTKYSIDSPSIVGYNPDKLLVSGEIDGKDKLEVVTYETSRHKLTVNYVNESLEPIYQSYERYYNYGDYYQVESPQIFEMDADRKFVTGTMLDEDIVETVIYRVVKDSIYERITSVNDITIDGKYILVTIYDNDTAYALNGDSPMEKFEVADYNRVIVDVVNDKIHIDSQLDNFYFELSEFYPMTTSFTAKLRNRRGEYLGSNVTNNHIYLDDNTEYVNVVSFDASGNVIVKSEVTTNFIRFNQATKQFRYYKPSSTGMKELQLFKLK